MKTVREAKARSRAVVPLKKKKKVEMNLTEMRCDVVDWIWHSTAPSSGLL
jgi:hypothetical protein